MKTLSGNKEISLSINQFALIMFGCIVGVGILSLPNDTVKVAHQDGWISALIGGIYPLYIVLVASYINNKFPNDNILILSKKYFGKFLGCILNLIFGTYFIFMATMISSYYANLMKNYAMGFLTSFKLISILFISVIYAVSRDLKVIGIISEIFFYLTILLILSSIPALKFANITNICPVFGSGFSSIVKGSIKSAFAYTGVEITLLIYPFLKEKNKMLPFSIIFIALAMVIYAWCVFITTYYLGPDIVNKSYWSLLLTTESVTISVINNYRFIFIFLWSLITFKTISINSYASIYILKDFAQKIDMKKIYFFTYPLFVYIALKYGNQITSPSISENVIKYYVIFNLLYITIISIFIFFKGGAKS